MAGDWIKLEHTTPDKPEVVTMAAKLGIDQDAVVGKLARIWIWADQNSINGNALTVTDAFIDRVTAQPGFAGALREVSWLSGRQGLLTIPNFDRHNGQTAKARAVTNRRVARHRSQSEGNGAGVTPVTLEPLPTPLPEKRREEEIHPHSPRSGGPTGAKGPDAAGVGLSDRQVYPGALGESPEFIACWEKEWLPYLLEKSGRMPAIITIDKQLAICLRIGPAKAIAGCRSSIEKGWASPDERAKPTGGHFLQERPWSDEPEGWRAYWRETYPPEEYPAAKRFDEQQWNDIPDRNRKEIWEGMRTAAKQRRAG